MTYGTWTTIDCPTDKSDEAFVWLNGQFNKLGARVYRKSNPHDFGSYSSFEVDKPSALEFIGTDDIDSGEACGYCGTCEDCKAIEAYEVWVDKANEIESEYGEKFAKWL